MNERLRASKSQHEDVDAPAPEPVSSPSTPKESFLVGTTSSTTGDAPEKISSQCADYPELEDGPGINAASISMLHAPEAWIELSEEERAAFVSAWTEDEGRHSHAAEAAHGEWQEGDGDGDGDEEASRLSTRAVVRDDPDALAPLVPASTWCAGRAGYAARHGAAIFSAANVLHAQGLGVLRAANAHMYEDAVRLTILVGAALACQASRAR